MNGINIDNPFSLLMNLGVGSFPQTPGLPQSPSVDGSVDLLGFVEALEVSQGPDSPMGESLDELVNKSVESDLSVAKAVEVGALSSDQVVMQMDHKNKTPVDLKLENLKEESPNTELITNVEVSAVGLLPKNLLEPKTINKSIVGQPQFVAPDVFTSGHEVSAETFLLGDMGFKNISKSENKTPMVSEHAVASWTKAFSQNDIESIDVVPSTDLKVSTTEKMPSEQVVSLGKGQLVAVEGLERSQRKPDASQQEVLVSSTPMQKKPAENFKSSNVVSKGESTFVLDPAVKNAASFVEKESLGSHKESSAQDAGAFVLGREVSMDSGLKTAESSALSKPFDLSTTSDHRLTEDSIKMLADKVDAMKNISSSSLRVVLNGDHGSKVEIRVSKIAGEMSVQLNSDSKELLTALNASKPELMATLNDKVGATRVEISSGAALSSHEILKNQATGSMARESLGSGDLLRMTTNSETKPSSMATSEFGSSSDFLSKNQQDQKEQGSRENSRDRGLQKWQNLFEERESA